MTLAAMGTNELIILFVLAISIVFVVLRFIFKYGKQKGRLEELEKRVNDTSKKQ